MAEEDIVEVEGKITAVLPSTMFRAQLQNGHQHYGIHNGNQHYCNQHNDHQHDHPNNYHDCDDAVSYTHLRAHET